MDLTLDELLGLIPCEEHITTVCQSAKSIPSLAQETKKLAKKLKEEEEASQLPGIPWRSSSWLIHRAAQLYPDSTADCSTTQCPRASTSKYN